MKMSAGVRTIFRKMLRDHPNILLQLNKKSEVNNLTRDDLIKIADNLGINFLQRLADVEGDFDPCNNGAKLNKDSKFSSPFTGQIEFSSDVIAFNLKRKVNLLVEYEYVPDWQFYCPVQKRLKYRCQSLSIKTYFQSTRNERNEGVANNFEEFGWRLTSDTVWNLFDPAVINEVNLAIDKQAWKLDQERRTAANLSTRMSGKPPLLDGVTEKSKLKKKIIPKQKIFACQDEWGEQIKKKIIDLQKERDAALIENDTKSKFLAIMSHEIRTPITSVLGIADMLLGDALSLSQRDKVEKLKEAAQSLIPIVNDILDFSKIQAGMVDFEAIDFDIYALIDEVTGLMQSRASAKGIELSRVIKPGLAAGFRSDPNRIRQILMNLLDNAIKFTTKGAIKLELEGDTHKGECLILKFKIIDTGIGISQAHQDSLFEAYKQLDVSTSRRYNGTGLGLAISKWLTELMGGEIGYESVEGKGSTFWFTIVGKPAAPGIEATKSNFTAKSYISTRSLRILLAEDNILNQQVIKAILLKLNHTVDAVSDGFAAVEAARSTRYDLVLMDVRMPKMDGLEASRLIRKSSKELSEIPIIAITADAMSKNHKRYFDRGLNDCVTKPIILQEFVQAINRVLDENVHVAANSNYRE